MYSFLKALGVQEIRSPHKEVKVISSVSLIIIILTIISGTQIERSTIIDACYKSCWVVSNLFNLRSEVLQRCVDNGYLFWESEWQNKYNRMQENFTTECNSIEANELFKPHNGHTLFKKLTKDSSCPIIIRNVMSYISDFNFNFNKINNSSLGYFCYNSDKITVQEYLNYESTHQIGSRISFLNVSDTYPKLLDAILDEKLFRIVFNEAKQLSGDPTLIIGHGVKDKNSTEISFSDRFHGDLMENINFQIIGQREWIFVDYKYLFLFKPKFNGPNIRLNTENNRYTHPDFKQLPHMKCNVNAGDMVYVPNGYLHKVSYPFVGNNNYSISVPVFFNNYKQLLKNHFVSALASFGSTFRKSQIKVVIQN